MASVPIVESVVVEGSRIVVRTRPGVLDPYLREPFWVEYDADVDPSTWPRAWQLAPYVLNVAPVVWAAGAHVRFEELDAALEASLEVVRQRFQAELYPQVGWSGTLSADRSTPARVDPADDRRVGVLFSGGLDSVATSFRQFDLPQTLVTVWGADVDEQGEAGWATVRGHAEQFRAAYGHELRFVRSNVRSFLDGWRLDRHHPSVPSWWGNVQHAMGFVGLAAPLLLAQGSSRLYIASTHTPTFAEAWGSSPRIDEAVRVDALTVVHDGYELSRQAKLREVQRVAHARSVPFPPLRVCYANPSGDGSNCGKCEKCLRTVVGMLLEDVDLATSGYDEPADAYLERVRRKFARHVMPSSANAAWMWGDLQRRGRELVAEGSAKDVAGWRSFLTWLTAFDFDAYARRYAWVRAARRRLQALLRGSPRLTAAARRWAIRVEER